jgi:excinuclease ABC subunit A
LKRLRAKGNSIFMVEHDLDLMRQADWLVDVGPLAGQYGGKVLYSGPPQGLAAVEASQTGPYLFGHRTPEARTLREPAAWLHLRDITRNNLQGASARIPLGCLCAVTGVSGSEKSSLVSLALVELLGDHLGDGAALPRTTTRPRTAAPRAWPKAHTLREASVETSIASTAWS